MKRYVGLDMSQKTTAICVADDEGRTLVEGVTATEPGAIATFMRQRAPDAERIGMETGPLAVWLWNALRALGLPLVCMDARHALAVEPAPAENEALLDRPGADQVKRPATASAVARILHDLATHFFLELPFFWKYQL